MDPGTALAVVSLCGQLFGACVQGYDIFSDAQNFGTAYGDFRWNLDTERGRLVRWMKEWEISDRDGSLHRKLNPEDWEYRYALATLARISGLFANLKNLDSTYGVHVDKRDEQCSNPGSSGVTRPRAILRHRTSRWIKSFLKHIKESDFPEKSKSLVSRPQQTASTSGSQSQIASSFSALPGGIAGVDTDIIAHLENPAALETKVLLPGLTDEITSLSKATEELHKILPAYKKLRWAISDKEKFEKLVQQLSKYNDGLYGILPPPNPMAGSMESKPLSTAKNQHYTVPHTSTLTFTGRSDVIRRMHQYFSGQASSDTTRQQRRFVLFGMGGSGKTQIAVKYAEEYRDCFWAIFWVDATSYETAEKDFCDIARVAKVEGNLRSAKQWLTSLEEEWLIIIDNADDPALDISKYFPSGNRGNILLTTRNRDCWRYGPNSHHETKEMDEDDAISLLLKASQNLENPEALQWAAPIVKELGFLALAIDQAGAYIANSCEISEYLDIYQKHRKDLLLWTSVQGTQSYKWTAYTTWELAFQRVQEENPVAADILQVFAFLHHEGITEEIFQRASIGLVESSASDTALHERLLRILQDGNESSWNSFRFRSHVEQLLRFSLVRREKNVYSVHPLVHSWARDRLKRQEQESFVKFTLCLLSNSITWKMESEDYAFRRQLISHIDTCMNFTDLSLNCLTDSKQDIDTALKFGLVYSESGRWKDTEKIQVQAVEARGIILGKEHPDTLISMGDLASTYRNLGRWEEAKELEERVVEAKERIFGKENRETLISMDNLAVTYQRLGRWEEAGKLGERVVERSENFLGKEHTDTLISMDNLASMYRHLGRLEEAEKLGERVLKVSDRILGKEHPRTLGSMAGLAMTYGGLGRWKEAEEIGERVFEARKRILGKEHPDTLNSMGGMALTYSRLGRWEEAKEMGEGVFEARKRILGEGHPDTLISMGDMALTYSSLGRWEEAGKLEERVVEGKERIFGKEHRETLISMDNLASTYRNLGRWEEAGKLGERVLEASERILGKEHPDTLICMENLALTYNSQGWYDWAEKMEERVFEARERVLGKQHPDTLRALKNLARTKEILGQSKEAKEIGVRVAEAS